MEVYCWKFVQYIKETLSLRVSVFYKVHNVILVSHLQLILLTSLGYKLIDRNKCRFFIFFFALSFLFLLMWCQRGRLLEGFTCRINSITVVLTLEWNTQFSRRSGYEKIIINHIVTDGFYKTIILLYSSNWNSLSVPSQPFFSWILIGA